MKSSIVITGLLGVGGLAVGLFFSRSFEEPTRELLESRGVGARLTEVGAADAKLLEQITHRLGKGDASEPAIDFNQPSEADIRFLMEIIHGRDPAARRSAARALVAIQEPRAVGGLVRMRGTPEEERWYCAGALEILRVQTRERAAELMIDVLEDLERPVTVACAEELRRKLDLIQGHSPEVLAAMLESESARVRRYGLKRLPPSDDLELQQRVRVLAGAADEEQARLARAWLERAVVAAGADTTPRRAKTAEGAP